jgi:hypothetical protein
MSEEDREEQAYQVFLLQQQAQKMKAAKQKHRRKNLAFFHGHLRYSTMVRNMLGYIREIQDRESGDPQPQLVQAKPVGQ